MAPQRVNSAQNHNRKRKSTNASQTTASSVESTNLDEFPAPPPSANAKPKAVPLKGVSPLHARTPIVRSPERKRVPGALSVVQKEALVENLRLESMITCSLWNPALIASQPGPSQTQTPDVKGTC